jgi:prolyl-tRNA editing enzyme YbaK/EbsC (Cys-tRNA(Pro) deacylase)
VRAFPGRQVEPVDRAVVSIAFPDSDADCLPPFGVFWRMPVYIDDALNNEPLIRFHAGSPNDIVTLRREDFDRLSQPICVHVARTANLPTPELARTASRVEARLAESASRS